MRSLAKDCGPCANASSTGAKSSRAPVTGREAPAERMAGSVAAHLIAAQRGARILRVHDVAQTVDALKIWNAVDAVPMPRAAAAAPAIRWPDE